MASIHVNCSNNNLGVLGHLCIFKSIYDLLSKILQVQIIKLVFVLDATKLPVWILFVL